MEYLIVDVDSRIIKIPEEVTHLGVKDDNETRTLKFQMPKVYKGLDLSDYSLEINFINANNKSDSALTENKQIDGDNITFEWCVGKSAYAKNGKVNFLVYAYLENEYGIKTNEWHTTWAKLDVLDGGNVNGAIAEENPRIIEEMLRRIKELENAEKDAVLYTAQTLTEEQQTQARANIGAASSAEVSKLSEEKVDTSAFSLGFDTDGLLYIFYDGKKLGIGVSIENASGSGDGTGTVPVFIADFSGESPSPLQFYSWEGRNYNGGITDALENIQCSDGVAKLVSVYNSDKSKWIKQHMSTGGLFESDDFNCKFKAKFCGLGGSWNNVITYGTGTHWTNGMYSDGVQWPAGGEIDAFEQAEGYSENPTGIVHTAHWGAGTLSGYPNTHEVLPDNVGGSTTITTDEWHDFEFSLKNGLVTCWIDNVKVKEFDLSECTVSNNYLFDYKPFLKPHAFYIDCGCVSSEENTHTDYEYVFEVTEFEIRQEALIECTGLEIYPQMWGKGTNLTFPVGAELYLDRIYTPSNVSNKACVWKSSDESVATVVQGHVKTLKDGTATITATCGNVSATYNLVVNNANANIPCVGIERKANALSGKVGNTINVMDYIYLYPKFTTDDVIISSGNSNITVSGTNIILNTSGNTQITVSCGLKTTTFDLEIITDAPIEMYTYDFYSDGAINTNPQTYDITFVQDAVYTVSYQIAERPNYTTGTREINTKFATPSNPSKLPYISYGANGGNGADNVAVNCYVGNSSSKVDIAEWEVGDWISIVLTANDNRDGKIYRNGVLIVDEQPVYASYVDVGTARRIIQGRDADCVKYGTGRVEVYQNDAHELYLK